MAYTVINRCPSADKPVFAIGNVLVWGSYASSVNYDPVEFWDIHLRLSDGFFTRKTFTQVRMTEKADVLFPGLKYNAVPAVVDIDWQDYGIPDLPKEWWEQFVTRLQAIETPMNMVVYCDGGVGRTGTALSLLAGLSGVTKGKDPLQFVRKAYCRLAVESDEQMDYIEDVTGIPVKHVHPPMPKTTGYGAYGNTTTKASTKSTEKFNDEEDPFDPLTMASYQDISGNTVVYDRNTLRQIRTIPPKDSDTSVLIPEDQLRFSVVASKDED